jgi:hypothetical protein
MRVACPFTPFVVSIVARIERRQVTPRRWRFRLRTLLFLVAALALIMGGVVTWQRREQSREWRRVLSLRQADYKARAAGYARTEASYRKASKTGETVTVTHGCDRGWATVSLRGPELVRLADEARTKRLKYEHAADCPWIAVDPDPIHDQVEKLIDEKGIVYSPRIPPELAAKARPPQTGVGVSKLELPLP